jgi:hypothetical protein
MMNSNQNDTSIKWDDIASKLPLTDGLSTIEIERARHGFEHIRSIFERDHPALNTAHPLANYLNNHAQWVNFWIYWLSEALYLAKKAPHFSNLLARLNDPNRFDEALLVLASAERLYRASLTVDFDVPTRIGSVEKYPDLFLTNLQGRDHLFAEVATLGQAYQEKRFWDSFRKLTDLFMWSDLLVSGRLHRHLSDRHLVELIPQVTNLLERVKTENRFHEFIIPDVIEIAAAPREQAPQVSFWCDQKGIATSQFTGPALDVDHLKRLQRKIGEEVKQLPADLPNLLIIKANDILLSASNPQSLVAPIEEMIFQQPNVCVVVICSDAIGIPRRGTTFYGIHQFARSSIGMTIQTHFTFLNKFCEAKIAPATFSKLMSAFGEIHLSNKELLR